MTEIHELLVGTLRGLPAAAAYASTSGTILAANRQARDELGFKSDRPEQPLTTVFSDPPDAIAGFLRMASRSPDPIPTALRVETDSGQTKNFICHGSLAMRRDGDRPPLLLLRFERRQNQNPFVLLSQTVEELTTEIKRRRTAEQALRARAQDAESSSRVKDEFLAALSHELRTPLNAILGWAELIRGGEVSAERRDHGLTVIIRNARIQAELIDELLDVSRIISGKMRLNVQHIDPVVAIDAALETIRPALEAKEIRLQRIVDPNAGPIAGDADRLQQIVWNLLSNAMKFTPKSGRIQLILERVGSSVQLTVSDSGRGIEPAFLPYVFDRFRQEDSTTTRSFGGLGLGLSIVKSLVELHGGTVHAASEGLQKGASFTIRLPRVIAVADEAPRPFTSVTSPSPAAAFPKIQLNGARILVVDDERDAADMLGAILSEFGAAMTVVTNAEAAIAAIRAAPPDLLISDIGMPIQDGYTLIRRVRAMSPEEGGQTPAIALTAFARSEDRTLALRSGFQAHLTKPVELAELLAVVASVLRRTP